MAHELIEQKEIKLIQIGNSKGFVIPTTWLEKMTANDDSLFRLRLMKGKHGIFFDGFKKKGR